MIPVQGYSWLLGSLELLELVAGREYRSAYHCKYQYRTKPPAAEFLFVHL